MNKKIDIVIPWVNGNDPDWQKEKEEYQRLLMPSKQIVSNVRYQSWDNLQYWFRAVEKFMPWVNHIFFVTWGHLPEFLKESHLKLTIVRHEDYIPKQYLPTFNSGTIEINYHRIEGLSENFILFNDDLFPLRPIKEEYFFKKNMVCDEAVESPIIPRFKDDGYRHFCEMQYNNIRIINRNFNKREVQKDYWKWFHPSYGELLKRNIGLHYWFNFVGFRDSHMPCPLKKSTIAKVWEVEADALDMSSRNKFRTGASDVNHYLFRYWQFCSGQFHPRKTVGKYNDVTIDNYQMVAAGIRRQKWPFVVTNENCTGEEFEVIKAEINAAFAEILPEKSSFEK